MQYDNWDDIKLTAAFIRSVYNNKMSRKDWQALSDEAYVKIHNFRSVYDNYTDIIQSLSYDNESLNIPLDDVTQEIYNYVNTQHAKGKKNSKSIVINGIEYSSVTEAAEKLNVTRSTIYNMLKNK